MSEIIGFCNQKGGVGKTTTAINLAASVAVAEKKVLLIDLDPQSNTTTGLGIQKNSIISNSYTMILNGVAAVPQQTALPFLEIIPASTGLVGAEVELVEFKDREKRLSRSLEKLRDQYDFIFIDAPPSLGLLTVNLLAATHSLIIPVQCEYYALEGLSDLLQTIEAVRQGINPDLQIFGILLTMFDGRNNLAHEVEKELRSHFGEKVFETVIPRSVRLSEAPSFGKPVILHDIKSRGAQSYLQLAQEVLTRVKTMSRMQNRVGTKGGETWNEKRSVAG